MIAMDTDLRPDASIDPLMQERLARLAQRRTGDAGTSAGQATTSTRSNGTNGTNGTNGSAGSRRTTAPTSRKRHAAQGSRTAAVMMSVGVAAGLTGYFQRADAAAAADAVAASSATASVAVASPASTSASSSAGTATGSATQVLQTGSGSTGTAVQSAGTDATAAAAVSATGLADGIYTGATDTNKWGPVQVQVTVSGGVITEVAALQTPSDDGKSVRINDRAVPVLVSETLAAQSADIHSVSGATYTSNSYKVSLQSAIDLAKATAQQAAA